MLSNYSFGLLCLLAVSMGVILMLSLRRNQSLRSRLSQRRQRLQSSRDVRNLLRKAYRSQVESSPPYVPLFLRRFKSFSSASEDTNQD
jgi:hypothetical protein